MRLLLVLLLAHSLKAVPQEVVVFWEEGFPTVESQPVSRAALEAALPGAAFKGLAEIRLDKALDGAGLLVLPYGSAVPVEAWPQIHAYVEAGGSLLVLGGRPLFVPVSQAGAKFVAGRPQNTYSRQLGLLHCYEAPQKDFAGFGWDESVAFLPPLEVRAQRVFVGNGSGLGYLLDGRGNRIAAPVTKRDRLGGRAVFLSFEPARGYWSSESGVALIRTAARYALRGAEWLRVEPASATLADGEVPEAVVQLKSLHRRLAGKVQMQLLSGSQALETVDLPCAGETLSEPVIFRSKLAPGPYTVRATYIDGEPREIYQTGFWVREPKLLASGAALGAAGDSFTAGGRPFLPFGTNYFTTDPDQGWFEGGGNAWIWERDFAEMERQGVTFVRTGIWRGNADFTDRMTGGANERFLRALEAYLHSAARHHMQVHFTFFAFDPQTIRRRSGEEPAELGPGSNPYTDPVAVRAEQSWVTSIARRFRDVPFLSWDLINEPSFSNPKRLWRTAPNGDPSEAAAWNGWLEKRYGSVAGLADAWGVPPEELRFGSIPLPGDDQLERARYGQLHQVRAIDYNLFAQEAFNRWVSQMIAAIRGAGSRQLVTVGQDEGGVTDRPLTQFYGGAGVDFTVNHTWWQDDALLWDSVAAKRPGSPNLIGETGVQPVWKLDGSSRWDEVTALGLFERKLALGFAAANSGSLHWLWAKGDEPFGIKRADGSNKIWMEALEGMAGFARQASPYAAGVAAPEVAIVLPQSLQLSVFGRYALEAQQKCVRALYSYARASAYAVGEYQAELLGQPRLILLPSPWLLSQPAWEAILAQVRRGAVLLTSGRFDADEHFRPQPRAEGLSLAYGPALLDQRDYAVRWRGRELRLSYSGEKTTYLERGQLDGGEMFTEKRVGEGTVLYFALPLELSDNLEAIGEVYRYALERARVAPVYTTQSTDPGISICPTRLENGTLYVLTSEAGTRQAVSFRDAASGKELNTALDPGRAAMVLVRRDGAVAASYNWAAR